MATMMSTRTDASQSAVAGAATALQRQEAAVVAEKVKQMLDACSKGDLPTIRSITQLPNGHVFVSQQDDTTGVSPLMVASQAGNIQLVEMLLNEGAPWNAIDRQGKCAGDYATNAEKWDVVNLLVEWATRSELILGTTQRSQQAATGTNNHQPPEDLTSTKTDYLSHNIRYNTDGTALLDQDNDAIMMAWERPIMKAHASIMLGGDGVDSSGVRAHRRFMNVGFGMGIIDTEIQENYKPSHHIIIEAHPQVYANMLKAGWDKKPGVQIYHGKWQDIIPKLIHDEQQKVQRNGDISTSSTNVSLDIDAIFYDTYAEHAMDMEDFHSYLPQLLSKRQGIYSFFNGLAPDNLFFHGVACNVVKLQLSQIGFDTEYLQCQIQANSDKVWDGVKRKYWHNRDTYYLPRITWNQEVLGRKNKAGSSSGGVDAAVGMDVEDEQGDPNNSKRQRMG